jgi:hypothetical protein
MRPMTHFNLFATQDLYQLCRPDHIGQAATLQSRHGAVPSRPSFPGWCSVNAGQCCGVLQHRVHIVGYLS